MWPLAAYVVLVLALFVRFVPPDAPPRRPVLATNPADVRVVRWQHRLFYTLLLVAPVEWWLRGRPAGTTALVGVALFLAGVIGYRVAGGALGDQLSPLVVPRDPAELVERGPYRYLRHPMSLAEIAMGIGAAVTLHAYASLLVTLAFTTVVLRRIALEESVLRERMPGYPAYAGRTYRLIPYVY